MPLSMPSTMRPMILLEINDNALRAQSTSAEALLSTLRGDFNYDILVFSGATGEIEQLEGSAPLSANVVAMPRERTSRVLRAVRLDR